MGKKNLKFVTANCSGNPSNSSDDDSDSDEPRARRTWKDTTGHSPATVRWSLLDPTPLLEGRYFKGTVPPDVYFLQEISCMQELMQSEVSVHYHVFIPEAGAEAGLLLLKSTFEQPEFFTGSQGPAARHLEEINARYADIDEGVTLDGNRVAFAVATPRGSNETILLVSYHGQYKTKNKQDLLKMLLELCERLRREVDASDFVIGGDFNLRVELARQDLHEHPEYGVAAAEPSSRRADRDVLDYFIHTRESFNVTDVRLGQFNDEVREWLNLRESDLTRYLDHDPIEMYATVKVVDTENGSEESDQESDAESEEESEKSEESEPENDKENEPEHDTENEPEQDTENEPENEENDCGQENDCGNDKESEWRPGRRRLVYVPQLGAGTEETVMVGTAAGVAAGVATGVATGALVVTETGALALATAVTAKGAVVVGGVLLSPVVLVPAVAAAAVGIGAGIVYKLVTSFRLW